MSSSSSQRVAAIDLTKGALVVCMVIYHSLNYSTQRQLAFQFLSFLPPSFILITGYLLSRVYLARHSLHDWHMHGRLFFRGLRLLALFTVLNVLVQLLIPRGIHGANPGVEFFFEHWFLTYISGNGWLAVFEVLLPIAFLLLLAPLLLTIERLHPVLLPAVTLAIVCGLFFMEQRGLSWLNGQLLSAGLVGILLGRFTTDQLSRLASFRWIVTSLYGACFAISFLRGQTFLLQMISAITALAGIYAWCLRMRPEENWAARRLEVMGRYSLVAYIAQIALLHVLARLLGHPQPVSLEFAGSFLATLGLTSAAAEALDWMRYRSHAVSEVYKAVFA